MAKPPERVLEGEILEPEPQKKSSAYGAGWFYEAGGSFKKTTLEQFTVIDAEGSMLEVTEVTKVIKP